MKTHKIVNIEKIIPDAYHGTKAKFARNICKNGFKISTGEKQFLGDGVYFFESSMIHAQNWARKQKEHSGEIIGVIKSVVNLGRCLDLHDKEHIELIADVAERLKKRINKNITDAVAINFIATNFNSIDSVRATYFSPHVKNMIFEGSRFYEYVRLMICIRNLKNILKISLAYEGE